MGYFLRSLQISGFKSFARGTSLEFTPGITALVGPNGSGKSNIVDAIRWCLGEQSMRDLRSQRAEDVIHAGRRRLLGMAEVSLAFEPDSSSDEFETDLCLTRRLFRSGDSEYLVNGQRARLRDLTLALKHVQIDAGRHVVVNQGMADAWLSATAVERRALIEQAAGLIGYRERRDDSRQKLTQTQRNLEMLIAVLAELEPRVRLLRRQARAVEERHDAREKLRTVLQLWYAHRWSTVTARREELREETQRLAFRRSAMTTALSEAEARAESRAMREREWNERANAAVRGLYDVERERDHRLAELSGVHSQRAAMARSLAEIDGRVQHLNVGAGAAECRISELVTALEDARVERARLAVDAAAQRAALQNLRERVNDVRRRNSNLAMQRHGAERDLARLRSRLQDVHVADEEDLRRSDVEVERRAGDEADLVTCRREGRAAATALDSAILRHKLLSDQLRDLLGQRDRTLRRRERMTVLVRRARDNCNEASRRLHVAQRNFSTLDAQAGMDLVSALQVSPGWETAIAAALGVWAFAGLSSGDGAYVHQFHDRDFDAWRAELSSRLGGHLCWADGLVGGAPTDLAHPLRCSLLVETEEEAKALWERAAALSAHTISTPPLQVVSRDGHYWSAVGAQPPPDDERASRFLQLRHTVRNLERKRDILAGRLAVLEKAERDVGEAVARLHFDVQKAEGETEAGAVAVMQLRERARSLDLREKGHLAEEAARRARLATLIKRRKERQAEDADLREQMGVVENVLVASLTDFETQNSFLMQTDQQERELHSSIDRIVMRDEVTAAAEASLSNQLTVAQRAFDESTEEHRDLLRRRHDLENAASASGERQASLDAELADLAETIASRYLDVERITREKPELEMSAPSLVECRNSLSAIIADHERALARQAQVEEQTRQLQEEIERELQTGPSALAAVSGDPPSDDDVRRIRNRATQYGDVDESVVAEFRAMQDRQSKLQANVDDLQGASKHLLGIIETADGEMRKQFDQAFNAVNGEFGRVFTIMLRGGEARLEQVQDTGGIEIHAQLPGRRTRASAAFSGGERALIASALLFGVLRIRPTPFCILDEVDAALDETNVDRYLSVLRDVGRQTQVIVVTHNRATMAAADALYGLTMDEEGVSSMLSLKLDAYDATE